MEAGTRRGSRVRTYDPWLTSIRFPNGAGRSARFSFAFSDTFVRQTNGKRRATRCYRWTKRTFLERNASARSSFPFPSHGRCEKRAATDTSGRENAPTPDEKVEKFHDDGRMAGEIGWRGNDRRIESLSNGKIENTRANGRAGSRWTDVSLEKSAL